MSGNAQELLNSYGSDNPAMPTSPHAEGLGTNMEPESANDGTPNYSNATYRAEALEGMRQYGYEPQGAAASGAASMPVRSNNRPRTLSRSDSVPVASMRGNGRSQAPRRPIPVSGGSDPQRRPARGFQEHSAEQSGSHNTGEPSVNRNNHPNVGISDMPRARAPHHPHQNRGNPRPPRRGGARQPTARPIDRSTLDEQSTVVAAVIPTVSL